MTTKADLAAALRQVLDEHEYGALGGRLLEEALADAALTTLSAPADPGLIREARTLATRKIEDSADGEAVQIMLGLICDELEAATELRAERDAALAAIERVRAIHVRDTPSIGGDWCLDDHHKWPCPTVAALDGAPGPEGKP